MQEHVKLALLNELGKPRFFLSNNQDSLIWCASKTSSYSVKLGYELVKVERVVAEWPKRLYWGEFVLPKAGAFAWVALHRMILMGERMEKLGILGPHRCVMCEQSSEDVQHILVRCDVAQSIWRFFCAKLGWHAPLANCLQDIFVSWPNIFKGAAYGGLWDVVPAMIVWQIWREQNARIFKGKPSSVEQVIWKVETGVCEHLNGKSMVSKYSFISAWDRKMAIAWPMLRPPIEKQLKTKGSRAQAKWLLPPKGRLKLNFDGASKGNSGLSGAGFIVRDENGKMLLVVSIKLQDGTNKEVECSTLFEGINLCIAKGWHNVDFKGDSQIVVNVVSSGQAPSWRLNQWVKEINMCLKGIQNHTLRHVYREANKPADLLSKIGVEQVEVKRMGAEEETWPNLQNLILADLNVRQDSLSPH